VVSARKSSWLILPLGIGILFLILWIWVIPYRLAQAGPLSIHDIQGAGHLSPYAGQVVNGVQGIVTAQRSNGFYFQEPNPDSDEATSEGIFVYLGMRPSLQVGDLISVTGLVEEDDPFSLSPGSLSLTRISSTIIQVQLLSSGLALPAPVLVGLGGRIPPDQVIEDDADSGDVENSGIFDPATDGLDFYESLEGMLVKVNNAVAVSGTSQEGLIAIVGDGGALAGSRTARGGLVVQADDFNPERLILEDAIVFAEPRVNVGAGFNGVITGIVDYNLGDFKLFNTQPLPPLSASGVVSETAADGLPDQLSLATFNTENLDPTDSSGKFAELALQIVHHLKSPDILALQEIQDNNGSFNDAVVTATLTYSNLIAAIQDAGGPLYNFRDITPLDGQDGGQVGGNIRVGLLFRPDRGLAFVDRPGGDAITPVTATMGASGVQLSISPGRVDPGNPAFVDSRKPLAGEFTFNGHKLIVIASHFNSKTDDSPLFGRYQPPLQPSQAKRIQQAAIVNAFVRHILSLDANANVIVLGDLNDFPFSSSLEVLKGGDLYNLLEILAMNEQYSYVFNGNSQAVDHILVSAHLLQRVAGVDIVHVNAEFAEANRPTDHAPLLARFRLVEQWQRLYLPLLSR